jgi:hypothetical protein
MAWGGGQLPEKKSGQEQRLLSSLELSDDQITPRPRKEPINFKPCLFLQVWSGVFSEQNGFLSCAGPDAGAFVVDFAADLS